MQKLIQETSGVQCVQQKLMLVIEERVHTNIHKVQIGVDKYSCQKLVIIAAMLKTKKQNFLKTA